MNAWVFWLVEDDEWAETRAISDLFSYCLVFLFIADHVDHQKYLNEH